VVVGFATAACSYHPSPLGMSSGDGGPTVDTVSAAWAFKRTLVIDNRGLSELTAFALDVTLDSTRITYGAAAPDGADLRFTDAAGAALDYEIERWDPAGTSTVWVRIPTIAADTTTEVTMFYGNPEAVDGQTPAAVWDADYLGVWHLVDGHDSTATSTSSNHGATPTTGQVGPALAFSGAGQYVDTGTTSYLPQWTLETWVNPASAAMATGAAGVVSGFPNYMILWSCNGATFCRTAMYNSSNPPTTHIASFSIPVGSWSHLVARYDGEAIETYVGGVRTDRMSATAAPDPATFTTKIGSRMDLAGDFFGSIDEVRISRSSRSQDYITAQFRSTSGTYVTYGPEQSN